MNFRFRQFKSAIFFGLQHPFIIVSYRLGYFLYEWNHLDCHSSMVIAYNEPMGYAWMEQMMEEGSVIPLEELSRPRSVSFYRGELIGNP